MTVVHRRGLRIKFSSSYFFSDIKYQNFVLRILLEMFYFVKTQWKEPLHVSKWVDNTNFQGLGYILSNKNSGVCFSNGSTIQKAYGTPSMTTTSGANPAEKVLIESPKTKAQYKAIRLVWAVIKRPKWWNSIFSVFNFRVHEEFKNYMEEKLVPAVTTLSSPNVGSEIFLQMSLRSTTSITFGLSDGTHQLNVLNGALKGLKVVVGHDGIVLISKLRTKKFFPWKNLLLKSCRVFNGQVLDQIIYH